MRLRSETCKVGKEEGLDYNLLWLWKREANTEEPVKQAEKVGLKSREEV